MVPKRECPQENGSFAISLWKASLYFKSVNYSYAFWHTRVISQS